MSEITGKIGEKRDVYGDCVDACSKKYFRGTQIGEDLTSTNEDKILYDPVIEFDRTECIRDCNSMYLVINGVKIRR